MNKGKKEYRNGTFIDESHEEYIKQMIINKTKGESNINDQNDTIDVKIDSDDHQINKTNRSKSVVEI